MSATLLVALIAVLGQAQGYGGQNTKLLAPNGEILKNYVTYYLSGNDTLELYCRGFAKFLRVMCESPYDAVPRHQIHSTEIVNETTIRIFMEKPNHSYTMCECEEGIFDKKGFQIYHNSAPVVSDFHCVSLHEQFINCSWTPMSVNYTNSLYYVNDGKPTLKCTDDGPEQLNYCSWHVGPSEAFRTDLIFSSDVHTFLMMSCTYEKCFNQTFIKERFSIIKARPVKDLEMNYNPFTPYQVKLIWMSDCLYSNEDDVKFSYKVQYWFRGTKLREVDTSPLDRQVGCYHEFDLDLPCADTQYEVRVALKFAASVGDEYWSDFSKINVRTKKDTRGTTVANPVCETRPQFTRNIMLYKISKLRERLWREQQRTSKQITSMSERFNGKTTQ